MVVVKDFGFELSVDDPKLSWHERSGLCLQPHARLYRANIVPRSLFTDRWIGWDILHKFKCNQAEGFYEGKRDKWSLRHFTI